VNLDVYASGSTEPWAAQVVAALAWSINAGNVLELGAFEGRTTLTLAQRLDANITAVEITSERATTTRKRLAEFTASPRIEVVEMDALKFLRRCISERRRFDFAFVDDDHTYAHVAEEVDLLKRVVRPGGLIVMHDVIGPFGLDALVRYHGGFIVELPLLHAAGGLGLVRV